MKNVLVPLAQGCEEIEAVTIIDLLRRADINVVSAGLDDKPVTASRGTVLVPDTTLDDALKQDFDMIVLPGGLPGANHLRDDPRIQNKLKQMAADNKYTAAICAAPIALASAGVLKNKKATCFPGSMDNSPTDTTTFMDEPVVVDDKVVTSKGPGTAMVFALTLIEELEGSAARDAVEAPLQRI